MEDIRREKISILMDQNRHENAIEIIQEGLKEDPNDVGLLKNYLVCLSNLNKLQEAVEVAKSLLSIVPDDPEVFYLYAMVLNHQDAHVAAEEMIRKAIKLYPVSDDFYALFSSILYHQNKKEKALKAAEKALSFDPSNVYALNLKSRINQSLGNKEAAQEGIAEALNENPHDPMTHTNQGWNLLESGKHEKALEHFKEALKQNPTSESAKAGMVNALKSKFIVFRWIFQFQIWLAHQPANLQWGIIIGIYILTRMMRSLSDTDGLLGTGMFVLYIGLIAFIFLSWIIHPVGNVFLRFNKHGKYALTENEIKVSNLVGGALFLGVLSLFVFSLSGWTIVFNLMLFFFLMTLPLSRTFSELRSAKKLNIIAVAIGCVGIYGIVMSQMMYFFIGIFIFSWVANSMND